MAHQRHVYLKMMSLDDARSVFFSTFPESVRRPAETLPINAARTRVLAAPVFARFSSPAFHAAAMDGVAVRAESTYGASEDEPRDLAVGREAVFVNTGHALPPAMDAVIMIEHVQEIDPETVRIESAAYPWQHVRKVGEDIVATEMILPQGTRLGPYELGALAAAGILEVSVRSRPRVTIVPTGSELMPLAEAARNGAPADKVVEFNSVILSALTEEHGGEPTVLPIVPDDYERIRDTLTAAVSSEADLIVINAGSSAGSEDYTAAAIAELGRILVHGVTIMPGKPTILGEIRGKPVIGNPGYPVSAVISFEQFAAPLLARLQGTGESERQALNVMPSQPLPSRLGLEEFLRVTLGRVRDKVVAVPLPRGAGSISTLTRADGVIRVPADSEGVAASETVKAELLRSRSEIEGALICIGSHDNTLDLLGDLLRRRDPRLRLASGNVGSLGGLLTLKRGHSHLAGSHLLDTNTGDYNTSYIKKHLDGFPVRLVHLVFREQGFLVAPGNPKHIRTFADLLRDDVRFINRQAGSGTRILLDYHLQRDGLDPGRIRGYETDEYTHMAVAAAVLSERADAGLAIYSSARALGLDFVPVATERYDLVIPGAFWEDSRIQTLLEVIRSDDFKDAAQALGGYGVERTGELLWSWDGRSG